VNRTERRKFYQDLRKYGKPNSFVATWDQNGLIDKSEVLPPQQGIIINSDTFPTHEEAAAFMCGWMAEKLGKINE
jgi:hypothetical protein